MGFLEETRTDTESYRQGMELFRRGNVQPGISGTDALCYDVGPAAQRVSLLASGEARCTCGAREQPCAHIVAATLAAHPIDKKERARNAFKVFDSDKDGLVSARELRHCLTTLGDKLPKEDVDEAYREVGITDDTMLDLDSFMTLMGVN